MPQGIVMMKMTMITPATAKARAIAQPAMINQMMFPMVLMMLWPIPPAGSSETSAVPGSASTTASPSALPSGPVGA